MKIIVTKDGKVFKDNTLLKPRLFKGYLPVCNQRLSEWYES